MPLAHHDYTQLLGQIRGTDFGGSLVLDATSRLVDQLLDESGAKAEVTVSEAPNRGGWSIQIDLAGQTLVLIDVIVAADTGAGLGEVDRSAALASARWRRVTRTAQSGELRPWIGTVVFVHDEDREVGELLHDLVRSRTLDVACRLGDSFGSEPGSPLGFNSFAAALLGRLVYLRVATANGD